MNKTLACMDKRTRAYHTDIGHFGCCCRWVGGGIGGGTRPRQAETRRRLHTLTQGLQRGSAGQSRAKTVQHLRCEAVAAARRWRVGELRVATLDEELNETFCSTVPQAPKYLTSAKKDSWFNETFNLYLPCPASDAYAKIQKNKMNVFGACPPFAPECRL